MPGACVFGHDGRPMFDGNGLAGLCGKFLKPIALGQVKQLRALLPDSIEVVGVGGVSEGRDAIDMLRAGASAVQVGSACYAHGAKVFQDILGTMPLEG